MRIPLLTCLRALPLALLGLGAAGPLEAGDTTPAAGTVDEAAAFFDEGRLHEVLLTFAAKDIAILEATAPIRRMPPPPGGPRPPGPPAADEPPGDDDFTYVPAQLAVDGGAPLRIAARWKGNSSYQSSRRHGKKSWKLDLDREVKGQAWLGLDKLNLQNATADSTLMRESVAFELYRRFGVAASRTTFARVTQAVEGGASRLLGTYTVVEQVDGRFLKRAFGTTHGLLLKPERAGDLRLREGEDPSALAQRLGAKRDGSAEERAAFHELVALLSTDPGAKRTEPEQQAWVQRLSERIDVEAVLRWWALATLLGDIDTLAGMGHNAYLYVRPSDRRLLIIPWDLNHAFGAMPMTSVEQAVAWSIDRPWTGSKRLFEHLLACPAWKARFRALLSEALQTVFNAPAVKPLVERRAAALRAGFSEPQSGLTLARWEESLSSDVERASPRGGEPGRAREAPPPGGVPGGPPGGFPGGPEPGLLSYVERRAAHVARQLAGEAEGTIIEGPGGRRPPGAPR